MDICIVNIKRKNTSANIKFKPMMLNFLVSFLFFFFLNTEIYIYGQEKKLYASMKKFVINVIVEDVFDRALLLRINLN